MDLREQRMRYFKSMTGTEPQTASPPAMASAPTAHVDPRVRQCFSVDLRTPVFSAF